MRQGNFDLLRVLIAFLPGIGTGIVWTGLLLWDRNSPPLPVIPVLPIMHTLVISWVVLTILCAWFVAMLNPDFPKSEGALKNQDLICWTGLFSICQFVIAPVMFVIVVVFSVMFIL